MNCQPGAAILPGPILGSPFSCIRFSKRFTIEVGRRAIHGKNIKMNWSMWRYLPVFLLLAGATAHADALWPQFRGPEGQGHADATGLPLTWSEQEGVRWKTAIPGRGWSSPVVAENKVWLTTASIQPASEVRRNAQVAGSIVAQALEVSELITLWVVELDLQSGKQLRKIKLFDVDAPQAIHKLNSYASPTPVYEAGRLYCHFGTNGTACLEISSGNILWQKRYALDHRVGPGSSPVVYKDLLILTCDGADEQYIIALDRQNGEPVWKKDRPPILSDDPESRKAFSTPLLINAAGKEQLVIPGAQWFVSYDPATGDEIWRVDHGKGFSNVPRPVFDGRLVFLCSGFTTGQLWAVRPDGHGDVTETHTEWVKKGQIPTMPSPLVVGDRIYTISDGGIAKCFNANTGDVLWKERMPGKYSASPMCADGKTYYCSHEGMTTVIAPGDEYRELAKNELAGQIMASPVVVEDELLLRSDTHLYRISDMVGQDFNPGS